jgi:hypothetical protein
MLHPMNATHNFYQIGLLIQALLWIKKVGLVPTSSPGAIEKLVEINLLLGWFPEARSLANMNKFSRNRFGEFVERFIQYCTTGYDLPYLRFLASVDENQNVDGGEVDDRAQRFYVMPDYIHESLQFTDYGRR